MKIIPALFLSALIIASCSTPKKTTSSANNFKTENIATSKQDGLTFETAVFITEKTELTGPSAEYKWIKKHYSNYKIKGQALVNHNSKPFDIITIVLEDNTELKLYFDISNYFGKF